ncbi:MAG TPA: FG-GAP-like repeat-containing protein [Solirubrobacteraceae bacterium]|jgi:hypothetical protein|nr:FG-GAP-like repeat-containing protein [Solirubrobacteraceae bacterium]
MRRIGLALITLLGSLALAAPASAAIGFDTNTIPVGSAPTQVVADFFHGGGNADLITANETSANLTLLLGNGGGGFANAGGSPFPGPSGTRAVATGDFNKDGNVDEVAVGNDSGGGNNVQVRLGNGAGGLGAPTNLTVPGKSLTGVVTGDFNRDNLLDFATTSSGGVPGQVNVFLGNGSGTTFTPAAATVPTSGGNTNIDSGDFNNDGNPDLAVTSDGSHNLQVFLGSGVGGGFVAQTPVDLGAATNPQFVAIGDLNNDRRPDAAVTNSVGGNAGVFVLLGNGSGGFSNTGSPAAFNAGASPAGIVIDDIDFDSNGDLVIANNSSPGAVTVLLNNGNGVSYTSNGPVAAGNGTRDVTTGDFNNDGNTDIAAVNSGSSTVTTLIQRPPSASVNPTSLSFGNVQVNTTSSTQTVTLTNNGPATIGPLAQVTGTNRGDFRLTNDRCSPSSVFLAPGQTCTVGVNVRSGVLGGKSATLEINSSNTSNSPQRVALSANIVPPRPGSVAAPAISGAAVVGNVVSCSNGTWTNSPTAFAQQWLRNGQPIPSAAGASYTVQEADVLQQLSCRVTASNAGGSGERTSSAVVPSANTPVLSVTVPKQTLNSVIRKGLAFRTSCQNGCLVSASVTGPVPPKKKKRSSRRGRAARTAVVGRTSASVAGGTTRNLRARISRAGRKALAKKRKATLRLTVTATDPSGRPSTTRTTSVSLKKAKAKRKKRTRK